MEETVKERLLLFIKEKGLSQKRFEETVQVQDRSAIGVEEYIEKIYTIKHRGDWGREAPKISCT